MDYVLTVEYDHDPECPMEGDGNWKLVSFNKRSIHYGEPWDYVKVKDAKLVPKAKLMAKFKTGLAFFLDYYEHGLGRYDIHGTGPQCRWDTSDYAGILIWEHKPSEMGAKTYDDRVKDAKAFLETYNNWMNGHVYGYMVDPADHVEDTNDAENESCWGFYEPDYMSKEIAYHFKPGDRVLVEGDCASVFDESCLPSGVTVVDDYDD